MTKPSRHSLPSMYHSSEREIRRLEEYKQRDAKKFAKRISRTHKK